MWQIDSRSFIRFTILVASALGMLLSGCSSLGPNPAEYDAAMSAPLTSDQARVCFVRQSSMLGAIVPHYVFDSGTGIDFDSTVIDASQWVDATTNLNITASSILIDRNILRRPFLFMVAKTHKPVPASFAESFSAYLVPSATAAYAKELKGKDLITGEWFTWVTTVDAQGPRIYGRIPHGLSMQIQQGQGARTFTSVSGSKAIELMAEEIGINSRYVGSVRSGGTILFDRPQGLMRLRVLVPGGDSAYSEDFELKRGKKYVAVYSYGGRSIAITERP